MTNHSAERTVVHKVPLPDHHETSEAEEEQQPLSLLAYPHRKGKVKFTTCITEIQHTLSKVSVIVATKSFLKSIHSVATLHLHSPSLTSPLSLSLSPLSPFLPSSPRKRENPSEYTSVLSVNSAPHHPDVGIVP